MRDTLNLLEGIGNELGKPLEGTLNPTALLKFLPDVTDKPKFVSALRKVMRNDEERLNRFELEQLGRAFISLVREESQDKMTTIRKMFQVHLSDQGDGK